MADAVPSPLDLSIITPSLNPGRYFEDCLTSVAREIVDSRHCLIVEHVVQDAGSHDGTLPRLADYAAKYEWLRYRVEPDEATYEGVNRAAARARGRYLLYLSADDVLAPGALAALATAIRAFPESDCFLGAGRVFEGSPPATPSLLQLPPADDAALFTSILFFNALTYSCVVSRRLWDTLGGYRPLHHSTDRDFMIRLLSATDPTRLDAEIGWFVIHPDSRTTGRDRRIIPRYIWEHLTYLDEHRSNARGHRRDLMNLWRTREILRLVRYMLLDPENMPRFLIEIARHSFRDPLWPSRVLELRRTTRALKPLIFPNRELPPSAPWATAA